MNPLKILRDAIEAVPAVRYALGVAGIAAVVAIVLGRYLSAEVAVFGTLVVVGLMFILVLFSQYAGSASAAALLGPITVLVWFYVIVLMVVTLLFISSYFLHVPQFPFHGDPVRVKPAVAQRFSHAFTFTQQPFSISMPDNATWNHGVSSLEEAGELNGRQIYVENLKITVGIDNKQQLVCCDVWVYLGAAPFGFPKNGGALGTGYPLYDEPTAAAKAPILAKLVIGSGGTVFPKGQQVFWAAYDFPKQQVSGYPQVDNVKQTVSQAIDLDGPLYAQVFVWNGNPSVSIDVTSLRVEIAGTVRLRN